MPRSGGAIILLPSLASLNLEDADVECVGDLEGEHCHPVGERYRERRSCESEKKRKDTFHYYYKFATAFLDENVFNIYDNMWVEMLKTRICHFQICTDF